MVRTGILLADLLTQRLFWWLLLAAVLGVLFPDGAQRLDGAVEVILAIMVGGLGVTLRLQDLGTAFRRPGPIVLGVGTQLVVLPLVGFIIWQVIDPRPETTGLVIQATAPAEITGPLMAVLAGGMLNLSVSIMATSLLIAPVTMPLLLRLILGRSVDVAVGSLFQSLAWTVALPLAVGSAATTALGYPETLRRVGPGVSGLMVVLLIFIVAGDASSDLGFGDWGDILLMAAGAAVLLAVGFGSGWVAGRLARLDRAEARSLVFTVGMREFGVASAVAISFFSARAAAAPAIYGVMMMLSAAWLASWLRRRSDARVPSVRPPVPAATRESGN